MKDKRIKFFQIAAIIFIKNGISFQSKSTYLTIGQIDITFDADDKNKVWVEQNGKWTSFTNVDEFKLLINKII